VLPPATRSPETGSPGKTAPNTEAITTNCANSTTISGFEASLNPTLVIKKKYLITGLSTGNSVVSPEYPPKKIHQRKFRDRRSFSLVVRENPFHLIALTL
jgi:hypothetical protein